MQNECEYSILKTVEVFIDIDGKIQKSLVGETNQYYIVEGDIIIAKKEEAYKDEEKGLIVPLSRGQRWPEGVLHYDWDTELENDQRILDAFAHWEANTKITFNRVINSEQDNYVVFQPSDGCSSYIGMIGGPQPINLSPLCSTGAVIHEIGHALGLFHEHTRPDRDEYIRVNYENIVKGMKHNFDIRFGQVFGEYDYDSIMHYSENAFSYNGLPTIEVLEDDPKPTIGNRQVLSENDINTIEVNYQNRFMPCDYEPCEPPHSITAGLILNDLMLTPYETDLDINTTLVIDKPITKVKNLRIDGQNATIELDIANSGNDLDNYFAVIVENLIFENVSATGFDLTVKWHETNIKNLIDSLKGDRGIDAPPVVGAGADGLPGGTGGKGRTKHGSTFFLFVQNLITNNGQKEDVTFKFDLEGLIGGTGGQGGNGSDGNKGSRGRNARNGDFGTCRRGGRHGNKGGNPGPGGRGGNGGCGGSGGSVKIYFNDNEFWSILGSSDFNLEGFQLRVNPEEPEQNNGGEPGVAGREGAPGDRGRHAGNCSRHSNSGARSGSPTHGSFEWQNWNLKKGLPSSPGRAGKQLYELLDNFTNAVFIDPNTK